MRHPQARLRLHAQGYEDKGGGAIPGKERQIKATESGDGLWKRKATESGTLEKKGNERSPEKRVSRGTYFGYTRKSMVYPDAGS